MLDIEAGFAATLDGNAVYLDAPHRTEMDDGSSAGYEADTDFNNHVEKLMLLNRQGDPDDQNQFLDALKLCTIVQHDFANEPDDDVRGRAIWCFGQSYRYGLTGYIRNWGRLQFDQSVAVTQPMDSPRAMAYTALGAAFVLDADPAHAAARALLCDHGLLLLQLLKPSSRPDWTWFETVVDGECFLLAEALIRAGRHFGRCDWIETGNDAYRWMQKMQNGANDLHWTIQPSAGEHGFARQ